MRSAIKLAFIFTFILILVMSFTSAQFTLVFGKVYKNNDVSDNGGISDAKVTVECSGKAYTNYTSENGDYAALFSDQDCKNGDSVKVTAEIESWKGTDSSKAVPCESDSNCGDVSASFVTVVNPIMSNQAAIIKSSGHKSGGSSGSTNIKTNITLNATKIDQNTTTKNENASELAGVNVTVENQQTLNDSADEKNGLSGVTGSFVASEGNGSWISILIILVVLVAVGIVVFSLKKPKNSFS